MKLEDRRFPASRFRGPLRAVVLAAALLCGSAAMGAPAGGEAKPAPNGGEVLLQRVPQGFKVASQEASADAQVQELIPAGQTLDNWTEMVTTQIFFGKGGWASEKVVSLIADQVAAACPDTRRGVPVQSQANNYTTTFLVLQCPNNPKTNKPE